MRQCHIFFLKKALNCRSLRSCLTSELFKSPCAFLPQYAGVRTAALLVRAVADAGAGGGARGATSALQMRDGAVSWVLPFLRLLRSAEQQDHSCPPSCLSCSTLSDDARVWRARAVTGHLPGESVVVRPTRWGGGVPMPLSISYHLYSQRRKFLVLVKPQRALRPM